ncbi:head-tail adaptor protein [Clostridium botulinum]|uniref:Phage head-tail adaptor n=1 Tax=Clostridium botulinum (strain Eklund 17B / Type B) TaxID=935198 RepID=B2THE8_CLOBB|nr:MULTISPECIES: phage head closure protein [Clostridium]ACD23984.1 putative phage head-tail adaptor [Clostridium botulinum B str. Eklund 17B (NRP)]MBY6977417.1 phage head closure protein [Clostridium botulinum]MBY7001972.1 phage head closure protein [Clostridium botulinum]MCR1275581.1 phage head closure protein [Clostridium botulinum]MCS6131408.1 head-tail adaptor protein [Clostridium botulinum]
MRKDKKITILEYVNGVDEDNLPLEEYVPVKGAENIWAYYRHLSGKEFYAAATTNSKVDVIFQINWRQGIDTTMKVLYNNKEYYITQIDDFEGKKTDLKIYAYKIN